MELPKLTRESSRGRIFVQAGGDQQPAPQTVPQSGGLTATHADRPLADGYHEIPPGRVATVVTHLEMTSPPPRISPRVRPGWAMRHEPALSPSAYRTLFRRIGEPWLWFSRLHMPDAALSALLSSPATMLWVLVSEGEDAGIVELAFHGPETCEVVFFGVIPDLIGSGAGRFMMSHALVEAWSRPGLTRMTVHTCTLDHQSALAFYQRSGFRAVRQQIEIAPDPRLAGSLRLEAAPHVPLIPATTKT